SSRRRHTRCYRDWSSDVCSSDLLLGESYCEMWRDQAYYARDTWRGRWDTEGGGVLMNQAPHNIDFLLWFMGPAEEIFGYWGNLRSEERRVGKGGGTRCRAMW